MNDDDSNGSSGLDLGLGELLATEDRGSSPAGTRSLDVDSFIHTLIKSRNKSEDPGNPSENDWEALWRNQQYDQITIEAEKRLAINADAVEARLWWIRAHCAIENMPLSIVAAPAEALMQKHSFSNGENDADHQSLFIKTMSELSNRCWERDLREKSIRLLHALSEVDRSHTSELYSRVCEERRNIDLSLLPIVERATASNFVEYLDTLRESLLQADQSLKQSIHKSAEASSRQQSHRATAGIFSIFSLPIKSAAVPLILLSAIAVAGYYGYQNGYNQSAPLHPPQIAGTGQGDTVALNIPMPERKTIADGPTLWNILQTLEDVDGTNQPLKIPREPVGVTNRSSPGRVNTTLPPEPAELALLIDAYDQREGVNARHVSPLNLNLDTPDAPEVLGERSSTIVQGYQSIAGIKRDEPTSGRFGIKNEKMYLVVDKTPVYSHPSFDAPSLAELQVGNHVEVAEILGEWLKIISAKDRVGYIQSTKAKPLAGS